jgi:predicted extracellular nuclease
VYYLHIKKERIMNYSAKIRTYDIEADERRAIEEAEARHTAHDTRQKLEQLHDAVLSIDAAIIGLMMGKKL